MKNKLCYILPKYDENTDEHYFHIIRLLEEIGRYVDVSLIIEKSRGIPEITNVKEIYPQRFGYSNKILRLLEMGYLTLKMRHKGYRKFFIRTSQTAAIPVGLLTKIVGGEVYLWRSGQGKEMIPRWSFKRDVIKEKLFSEYTFNLAIKLVDYFVTGPESMAYYFTREWSVNPKKIVILYNDVDIKRFQGASDRNAVDEMRNILGLPMNKKIILMVHRLSPVRRTLNYLPQVMVDIISKRNDVLFLIIGDGAEKEEMERRITDSGIQEHVIMTGSLPNKDIYKYYRSADVFMMPSYVEGFPRVLIEAMASGLPFVSTDAGGVRDLVTDGQQRFVVPKEDVDAFSNRLLELLGDEDLRLKLGKGNREHVKKYSVENVAKMYIERIFPVNIYSLEGYLEKYIKQLIELDQYYIKEMGDLYSHQPWEDRHFRKRLNGKEKYSRIALNCDHKVVGFWITSLTDEKSIHTHRVAIARDYRGTGLAKRMFDEIASEAKLDGINEMTIGVSILNQRAISFYKALGFKSLKDDELQSFINKKGRSVKTNGEWIEEAEGAKYYILSRNL